MDVDRLEHLTQKVGGRFRLTALLQKRLAELVKGSPPLVDLPSNNFFEIALREIEEGRIELLRAWTAQDGTARSVCGARRERGRGMKGAHILLGVTGSIAAFKAADLTAGLTRDGAEVTVIMTESAQRFVAPLTFETLARRPVITSMWARTTEIEPVHVELAEWADLLVVAPATANFIGKLAHGIADDMLSCMAITMTRPPLIAPAMNDNMYRHPAVQAEHPHAARSAAARSSAPSKAAWPAAKSRSAGSPMWRTSLPRSSGR